MKELIGCWIDGGLGRTDRRRVLDLVNGLGRSLQGLGFPFDAWQSRLQDLDRGYDFDNPDYWFDVEDELLEELSEYLPEDLDILLESGDVVVLPRN